MGSLVLASLLVPLGGVVSSCGMVIGLDSIDRVQCVGVCGPDAGAFDVTTQRTPDSSGSGKSNPPDGSASLDTGPPDTGGTYDAATTADGAAACHADADCSDPMLPRCDRNTGNCVVCLPTGTNTCPMGQICKLFASTYMCAAGCITSADCPAGDGGGPETCCNTVCVDTTTNPGNCGGCSVTCSANNIPVPTCTGGLCSGTCATGFADCNANKTTDGCEKSVASDPTNCGGCGTVCSSENVTAPTCTGGVCTSPCSPGFSDCDHDLQTDGCETSTRGSDVANCGGCGVACSGANITATCTAGVCDGACAAGFADCDNNKQSDGCEVQIDGSDCANCGACGAACSACDVCEGGTQVFVCCPYVFAYDGAGFVYETSIGGASVVGRKSHAKTGKDLDFAPLWVRLDHSKVDWSSGAGVVRSKVIAAEDEIVYFDETFLTAVAHPLGYEVVSSSAIEWEQTLHAKDPREFYVLRTAGLRTPLRATWMGRQDVTRELAEKDEVPAAFDTSLGNYYDVDFGPVAKGSAGRWLVVDGWKFKQPRDLAPGVGKDKPVLLVHQLDGSWLAAKDLATPKGDKKAVAFDLSDVRFPTGRLEMRIVTGTHEDGHAMWYLDRLRISEEQALLGEAVEVPLETATLEFMGPPSVEGPLEFWHPVHATDDGRGELGDKFLTYGAFTRYGDVRALLAAPDDEMVVMRRGDGVELRFVGVPSARPGEEVSLFLETDLLFKPRVLFGVGTKEMEEVLPLPYHGMGHYPPNAPFPRDPAHDAWQAKYETRVYERGDTRWGE